MRVLGLSNRRFTVRVPVFPQSPKSLLNSECSGRSRKSDWTLLGALGFEFGLNVFTIFIVNDDFGVCESRVVRNEFRF